MITTTGQVEKRKDRRGGIPACPIMSIAQPSEVLCIQDACAWYSKNYKMCAVFLVGHNAALDIKAKQIARK
ncbi:MAG: hypothetical protein K6C94_05530 [Candidatus Gastranaerophilales bacterium]|nr:hypothetical protein [Candidatus Gastranaerophilales bacterium]